MDKGSWLHRAGRAVRRLIVVEVMVIAAALALALLLGWHSSNEISLVLTMVGVFIFAIGPFSLIGGWGSTRTFQYQYVRTMEDNHADFRRRQDAQEVARDASLVLPSMLLGVATMVLGALIQTFF
ncbi:hypothetical protein [Aggregatilinea lenta]|uniref:hypothetical protein n=1 Tax=Aggregatilinea lenta TaxID=913108 RepID=UPI0013C3664C|nr:hypothetical protein [Aggregatilinea lenta]